MNGNFRANNLSNIARRVAYAAGMKTVKRFDVLRAGDPAQLAPETPVLRLYNTKRELVIRARDLCGGFSIPENALAPMARVS